MLDGVRKGWKWVCVFYKGLSKIKEILFYLQISRQTFHSFSAIPWVFGEFSELDIKLAIFFSEKKNRNTRIIFRTTLIPNWINLCFIINSFWSNGNGSFPINSLINSFARELNTNIVEFIEMIGKYCGNLYISSFEK